MAYKDQGSTLTELLVVITVIGILTAIAIPVFLNQRKQGVDESMKLDLKSVAFQMDSYFVDQEAFPVNAGDVVSPTGWGTAGSNFTDNNQAIRVTAGNTVTNVTGTGVSAGTYCMSVTSTAANSGDLWYDSDKGGWQPLGTTACA